MVYDLAVIGGGAAGFYGAVQFSEMAGSPPVIILEKTSKLLAKVKVSGGGRCNVTHSCFEPKKLSKHYPRGEKPLHRLFRDYQVEDVVAWFALRGVDLKTEEDGRMFPTTDDSQTIIDALVNDAISRKIKIEVGVEVQQILSKDEGFELQLSGGKTLRCKNVLVATGGSPKFESYQFLSEIGLKIVSPIPSLFTFNDSKKEFQDLMGVSVSNGLVRIEGTNYSNTGPVLITHWGLSGPAVIRLSAWAAEHLHSVHYNFSVLISWIGDAKEEPLREELIQLKRDRPKQKVKNNPMFNLPARLWTRLCELSEIPDEKIWSELPMKNLNKLLEQLIRCRFAIKGKTTFKEEFVTCGGVDLAEVDLSTMESKKVNGLYFAGEVLNIDGETGGFNFQAAWTTSYIAARSIASKFKK